jgi:hypothetical protein
MSDYYPKSKDFFNHRNETPLKQKDQGIHFGGITILRERILAF